MPENIKEIVEPETQGDVDLSEALTEISQDLFGQGESKETPAKEESAPAGEGQEQSPEAKEGSSASETEVVAAPDPQTSEEVQALGAPSTWTKEAIAEWATISPRAQQEILKREEDALRGITMYKDRAEIGDRYNKVVEPYAPILAAEQIDPVQLFQSFASNHYLLSRGTPEQKVQLAANLISSYGVDFQALLSHIGDAALTPPDPQITALQREVAELKAGRQAETAASVEATSARLASEIDAFATDPAHPYFEEVVDDIAGLFKSGQATTLAEAYEKAIWLNPATRSKEQERLATEKASALAAAEAERQAKLARTTGADLNVSTKPRSGTIPVGTLDETLEATMAQIRDRG